MMGKKKIKPTYKNTKETSIAIAEASSAMEESSLQQEQQPQTPRKRGRPRKIVIEKTEIEGNMGLTSEKKTKVKENEQEATDQVSKQESDQQPQQPPKTNRARRKGKPHKSS